MTENAEQDETVVAVVAAFVSDAKRMAEMTAAFLNRIGSSRSVWPATFLLELAGVLRIRQWELGGIKDAICAGLPSSSEALSDLAHRLQTEPETFMRGELPLLRRVLVSWWFHCAHPNDCYLNADFVVSPVDRGQLLSIVAQLLWNLRDLNIGNTLEIESDEQ